MDDAGAGNGYRAPVSASSTPSAIDPGHPLQRRLARARYRAWHRGTREADFLIGGFFDRHHAAWQDAELTWFEALLDEEDVDIMAWALRASPAPQRYHGPLLQLLEKTDYVTI